MSFRIAKHPAFVADGFRTALRQQIARAIKELEGSPRKKPTVMAHSARKRIKKVRSAFRLLKAASFPAVSKTDFDLLRDASAEVAPTRDTIASLNALKQLCAKSGNDNLRFSRAFGLLEKQKDAALRGTQDAMHRAVTLLKASLSRIESWNDDPLAWKKVGGGLKHFYKRGRATFRKAADDSSTENLHRWRTRAKDLFHGLKLLQAANPNSVRRLSRDVKKLGELLGFDHDLATLKEALDGAGIGKEKPVIDKLIAARRRKLQCKALKLGAKYFSRKPDAFVEKIDG